jgi:DNA-binding response OmpR family regulator
MMNKNIVIVDDDEDILEVVKYILDEEGYHVIVFDHLVELEKIAAQQPSVVLLDNKLAGVFSDSWCIALKSDHTTKVIPVILVSANEGIEQIANKCKADAFLPKPFDLNDLISLVRHHSQVYNNLL